MRKLLLHVCCAPCAPYIIEELKKDYDITLYYYNPNIELEEEYNKRLESVRILADQHELKLIEEKYNNKEWKDYIKGLEEEPEGGKRCDSCIRFRLEKTAEYAKDNFDMFATTLTISPYKKSRNINKIGTIIGLANNILFLAKDFSAGYKKSIELSKNFYRQKYCGCLFSKK